MLLGHDVVADRETKSGALAGRLGREEWLKQLIPDLGRDADAVVTCANFDRISQVSGRHFQRRLKLRVAALPLALGSGIEAVAEQVQSNSRNVLRYQFDRSDVAGIISVERDIEALILRPATVIGEVECFID